MVKTELLRIARKHQKRGKKMLSIMAVGVTYVAALVMRMQPTSMLPSPSLHFPLASTSHQPASKNVPDQLLTVSTEKQPVVPIQFQLALDALSYLFNDLEKDNGNNLVFITLKDIAYLRTCVQALLAASYHCIYMAARISYTSDESCWIGWGVSRTEGDRNASVERDWAQGRQYYEAYYIFRLAIEDIVSFLKAESSIPTKLSASFEQSLKDLKLETIAH
ncbi:hypothetical protein BG011_006751, partial [Mortierella polycephala]